MQTRAIILKDVFTPEVLSKAKSIRCKSISHIKDEGDEIFYQAIIWDVTFKKYRARSKYFTNKAKFKDQIKKVLYEDYNIEARSGITGKVDLYRKDEEAPYSTLFMSDELIALLSVLKQKIDLEE